jgi:hypothetical protein
MNVSTKRRFPIHVLATCSLLSACANRPTPTLTPKVVTQRVDVPVAIRCAADPGPEPQYVDTPEALRAATDLYARVRLLLAGRDQRDARLAELSAALAGCR